MILNSFEDNVGICQLASPENMLAHALLQFLFFNRGFIQISFVIFEFILF